MPCIEAKVGMKMYGWERGGVTFWQNVEQDPDRARADLLSCRTSTLHLSSTNDWEDRLHCALGQQRLSFENKVNISTYSI